MLKKKKLDLVRSKTIVFSSSSMLLKQNFRKIIQRFILREYKNFIHILLMHLRFFQYYLDSQFN